MCRKKNSQVKTRDETTRRLLERGEELIRSGSAADQLVARELFIEARDRAAATMRDLEKAHPALKAIGKAMRKRKAAT